MTFRPYATRCPVLRAQLPRSGGLLLEKPRGKGPHGQDKTRYRQGIHAIDNIIRSTIYIYG